MLKGVVNPVPDTSTAAANDVLTYNGTNIVWDSPGSGVPGSGTVTSVSVVTANGLSGTVATATTTPAITLDVSGLDAAKIADGTVSNAEFQYINTLSSNAQTQINAKQATLSGAVLTAVTVAGADKVLIQDVSDSDNLKTVTAQSIADLSPSLGDGDKGDITVSSSGTVWTIDNGAVTLAKQADMATASVVYRKTAGTGVPEVNTLATLKTDLGLTGTNSGDQTSIVGITGTKAQFDTAVTDGNFLYVGDVTQYTDEMAQDAVGGMVSTAFTYTDVTPSLALTSRTIGGVAYDGTANITVASATGGFTVSGGNLTVSANNIATDTTTGTKFGTATNQKISFYNSTPIVQPTGNALTALSNLGLVATPTLTSSDVDLGSVTNDAQTKAAIVPNTAPSAGQILVGNAGGTAYAPVSVSGAFTLASTGAATIATPGTLTVSSTNSTATAHTHAITSSSAPGAAASILATDSSGIIGSTGTRIVKGWFTDLTVTNAISGSITGNAATVTTNANLTGAVTSSGNATSLGSFTFAQLNAAVSDANVARTDAANTFTGVQTMTSPAITTPAITGLATGTGVSATATVSTLASRDSSGNSGFNNALEGYTTTVTAAGTTTLTVGSTADQYFTGSTTQTVTLPVASTLTLGHTFNIDNASTGAVTVNSSGGNAVLVLAGGTSAMVSCILTSGTGAGSWKATYLGDIVASGKKLSVSNTLTFTGTDSSSVAFGTGGTVAYTANKLSAFAATTSAELAGVISDETGSGALVFGTAPTFTTGITTPKVTFNSTSGIIGTTTNDSAAAGSVGEYITSSVAVGSAVSLTTTVAANMTSISLTAGDWDVEGTVWYTAGASTVTSAVIAAVNTTSATLPTVPAGGRAQWSDSNAITGNLVPSLAITKNRISVSGTTTVYMVAYGQFTTSTLGAYGIIVARRVR